MPIPINTDLIYYTNKVLTDKDWKHNFDKIIEWLTDGTYDLNIAGLTINGSLIYNGNITTSGTITANAFIGDGSALTNIGINNKNWLLNGGCQVDSNETAVNLVLNTWHTRANEWEGMATGTAVTAGTYSRTETGIGTTGSAIKFATVSLTGTGIAYIRQQRSSGDSKKLKGQNISVQARVYQNTGVNINYVIHLGKASAQDNFTTVNNISSSANIVVPSGTATLIKYENVALGDCSNGLEVKIEADCGIVTAKNFEFTEIQLEISPTITNFEFRPYDYECLLCNVSLPINNLPAGFVAVKPALDILQRFTAFGLRCKIRSPGLTGAPAGYFIAGYDKNVALIVSSESGVPLTTSPAISEFIAANAGDTVPVISISNSGSGADIVGNSSNWQINKDGTCSFKDTSSNSYSVDDLIAISMVF